MNDKTTEHWKLYEAGLKYNNRILGPDKSYLGNIDANIAFFAGDQWRNVPSNDMPKPVFNYIKRILSFFVASITSNNTTVNFETLEYTEEERNKEILGQTDGEVKASEIANAEVKNILEKSNFDNLLRKLLTNAGITGDMALHMYFDVNKLPYNGRFKGIKGEIQMEVVDGSNVMFGNANNPNVEIQPYIIVVGRDIAKNLENEAKEFKNKVEIKSDNSWENQQGDNGKIEVESDNYGKALYIIVYERNTKTGTIKATKCTEKAYIYKDIDTGYNRYPVSFGNWEDQTNQYHGRSVVTGMIPNQIFINKMFAMAMYHLMMTAFPPTVYDASRINGINNAVGATIPIEKLQPNESFNNLIGTIPVPPMSGNIMQFIEKTIEYTKEAMGINDASMGNVRPENTSAIIAVQKSTVVPLENVRANLYQFVEDTAAILLDMIGTKYGTRPVLVNSGETRKVVEYDFKIFKNLWLNMKVNVGNSTPWSEMASQATLDNLLQLEKLEFIDYLERMSDTAIPKKDELIQKIKQGTPNAVEYENLAQVFDSLPEDMQAKIQSLPDAEQEAAIREIAAMQQNAQPQQR